jgi:Holliday junction resolvase RusA-like endonuclease
MINTEQFKLVVYGEPISKANAAFAKYSRAEGTIKIHIPDKFVEYEAIIKEQAVKLLGEGKLATYTWGPVCVNIDYYLSENRVKDLPNLPKTTCDALNSVLYKDDSQIVSMILNKYYSKTQARVEITVSRPLGDWEEKMNNDTWSLPPTLRKPPKKLNLKSATDSTPIKVKPKAKKPCARTKKSKAKIGAVSPTGYTGGA